MPNNTWCEVHRGTVALLPIADIDTDQIIPARFLKSIQRDGLGRHLFADWRVAPDGSPRADHPITRAAALGATILVAGPNFGCGSSREHAAWALQDFGFRAVVAPSFSDIFRANALKNHLLPIALEWSQWESLVARLDSDPEGKMSIDLESTTVSLGDWRVAFSIDDFARHCLLEGLDELGFLLSLGDRIASFERRHPLPDLAALFREGTHGR